MRYIVACFTVGEFWHAFHVCSMIQAVFVQANQSLVLRDGNVTLNYVCTLLYCRLICLGCKKDRKDAMKVKENKCTWGTCMSDVYCCYYYLT